MENGDILNVELNSVQGMDTEFVLIDAFGKTIRSWNMYQTESVTQLNISSIPNGVYFLSLSTPDGKETVKVALAR